MLPRFRKSPLFAAGLGLALAGTLAVRAFGASGIERASVSPLGVEGNRSSYGPPSVSDNGRFVAFASQASNLYGQDSNGVADIFMRDRVTGFTRLASVGNPTAVGQTRPVLNGPSLEQSLSGDGSIIAYASRASNVVTGDTNDKFDIFVRTLQGDNVRASVTSAGVQSNGDSGEPALASDGSAVAYTSAATNLVGGDGNAKNDVFLTRISPNLAGGFDVLSTQRVSIDSADTDGNSQHPAISADGRYVAFDSDATNLDPADGNGATDVFVKDTLTGLVERVSVDSNGSEGNGASSLPAISADGRFVAFVSAADNLVPNDSNGVSDIFVRDRLLGLTERVSLDSTGAEGDGDSGVVQSILGISTRGRPSISADGRFVAFTSQATNLDPLDGNGVADIFVFDRTNLTVSRASAFGGVEGDGDSVGAALNANATVVAFESAASTLVNGDTNLALDIFVADLGSGGGGNLPPTADAGADQQVFEGDTVFLDASGSTDPENDILTFSWSQINGPTVTLDDPTSATPSFTAPLVTDFAIVTMEVSVSDGVNPPETADVEIDINVAPPSTITGQVTDASDNAIVGATITVTRSDGATADPASTDGGGFYSATGVRTGSNTIVVSAPGFEPVVDTIDVPSGVTIDYSVVLDTPTASLVGTVLLSDGSPLVGGTVELVDASGGVLASDQIDSAGEYVINDLDRFTLANVKLARVSKPGIVTWNDAGLVLTQSMVNRKDYQYGRLQVTVTTNPKKLQNLLNGTTVDIVSGNQIVAENQASKKVRTLTFPNLPAQGLKVKALNPALTGTVLSVNIPSGRRGLKVTAVLLSRGVF